MTDETITRLLFLRHDPVKADLAIVFGHNDIAVAARRARQGAEFYCQRLVPRLLLSGGPLRGRPHVSEAEHMAQVATAMGVPDDVLLLEHEARTTVQNAQNALALLVGRELLPGLSSLLLVSCPWHMRRVFEISRRVFPEGIRLFCCPHQEWCMEQTWPLSLESRTVVETEFRLLERHFPEIAKLDA